MKRSDRRILTTHAGSLPRPADLVDLLQRSPRDETACETRVQSAVSDAVRRQAETGLDVVTDGEMSKLSFITYVTDRLTGFEPSREPGTLPWAGSKEVAAFPEFYEPSVRQSPNAAAPRFECTGPITYRGHAQVQRDIENLGAALRGLPVEEAFLPAIAPSNVEGRQKNRHYKTDEDYLFAIATYYILRRDSTVEECRRWAAVRVEALNHALRDLPRGRVRFHTCYSINMSPRVHDMELKDVVDLILRVKAGAYSFEAANPRHEHEWRVWQSVRLPDEAVLIPGVITQSTVLVEHPELVAERIARFVSVVGRERVIAGADCGFASFAGSNEIHPSIVWAKLKALVEGARLASRQLWT